ncbi:MAG: hypothetical protein M1838_000059 [Thelocarpon superellum]|nr:MAG: hypothetical protein M1838_000059 [Thelocarpon superellum]
MKSFTLLLNIWACGSAIGVSAAPRPHGHAIANASALIGSSPTHGSASPTASTGSSVQHIRGGSEYVIIFDPNHPEPPEVSHILGKIGMNTSHPDVTYVYNNSAFRGFAGKIQNHSVSALNSMAEVKTVEQSIQVKSFSEEVRGNSPWGLQRVSQEAQVTGDANQMAFQYQFSSDGGLGKGVDIYVVDTGINTAHLAFGGRATMGFSMNGDGDLTAASDQDGHGTHVSGTAAASLFGVASGANLIGVKVLGANGSGMSSDTIKGLDYLVQQHDQKKQRPGFVGSIASMSWGLSSRSSSVEQAIGAAVDAGIHVTVAAGNDHEDACNTAPASTGGKGADGKGGKAVAVGSINIGDQISTFSNTGSCVDVYAPGENVLSTWIGGTNTVQSLSGTSMSTPHVTGVMAYLMAQNSQLASSPAAMKAFLASSALPGIVQGNGNVASGDNQLLLNNGIQGSPSTGTTGSNDNSKRQFRRGPIFSPHLVGLSETTQLRY